jgi:hypothetical protein
MDNVNKEYAKLISEAIFYASIQASIGSVEMSSKFSVKNFSKDQDTLNNAAIALKNYIWIASIWTVGTILSLFATHGPIGVVIGLIANAVMMGWIIGSYKLSFQEAAEKYKLVEPVLFSTSEWVIMLLLVTLVSGLGCYFIPH